MPEARWRFGRRYVSRQAKANALENLQLADGQPYRSGSSCRSRRRSAANNARSAMDEKAIALVPAAHWEGAQGRLGTPLHFGD
jgi:hypothetical protein